MFFFIQPAGDFQQNYIKTDNVKKNNYKNNQINFFV